MKLTILGPKLVLLVGPSGCGKSAFAHEHFLSSEILSSDAFRSLISDDEASWIATPDAFEVLHLVASKRLAAGKLAIIDATNLQVKARQPLLAIAQKLGTPSIAIVFDLPKNLCVDRDSKRPGRSIGPDAIDRHFGELRQALLDLPTEGFEQIYIFHSVEDVASIEIERQSISASLKGLPADQIASPSSSSGFDNEASLRSLVGEHPVEISESQLGQIRGVIAKASVIHVYTHAYPDGDAIASLATVSCALRQIGKSVICRCDTPIADMYRWLHVDITQSRHLPLPDAIIAVDFGEYHQLGTLYESVEGDFHSVPVINIDHHVLTNAKYGTINLVVNAASTTEILYSLFRQWPIKIHKELATYILYGIVSDTFFFQKSNTSSETLKIAMELGNLGANPHLVAQRLHKTKTESAIRLWGLALSSMKFHQDGQLAVCSISANQFKEHGVEEHTANLDALVNFMTAVATTRITVLLKQRKDEVRVSFRADFFRKSDLDSELELINVSQVAQRFGGGGHVSASGCSIREPLEVAEELIVSACIEALMDPSYRETYFDE